MQSHVLRLVVWAASLTSFLCWQVHCSLHDVRKFVLQLCSYSYWWLTIFTRFNWFLFDSDLFSFYGVMVLEYWWDWSTMRTVSGAMIFIDGSWCVGASDTGFVIPRPPSRTGKAISSRVTSLKASWPAKDVRDFIWLLPRVVRVGHRCWGWL